METRSSEHEGVRPFLNSVDRMRRAYLRQQSKVERIESTCQKLTANFSGMPRSGSADAQALWAKLADERSLATTLYRRMLDQETAVERFIAELPSEIHQAILLERYVDSAGKPWPEVTTELAKHYRLYYTERHVQRLHGAALESARLMWARPHIRDRYNTRNAAPDNIDTEET